VSAARRGLLWPACVAVLVWCVGCSGSDGNRTDDMGLFSSRKTNDSTTVNPMVGAQLARASQFPAAASVPPALGMSCNQFAVDGVPPNATFRTDGTPGQATTAYLVSGAGNPPLAFVSVGGADLNVEIWELSPGDERKFVRKRDLRLDPEQDKWVGFLLADVACLPQNRVLLAVAYFAPHVKHALFVYDIARNAVRKVADIAPDPRVRDKFFEAQTIAPEAAMVLYYTGATRVGPEVYYNANNHLLLFDARHADGLEVLRLAAADGSVERWHVSDKTLWLQATDKRDPRRATTQFVWSLDLSKVLP
jgi:hypothetical protein